VAARLQRKVIMVRKKSAPPPPPVAPSAEQVKALIDQMDWAGQSNLFHLLLADRKSHLGYLIRALARMIIHYKAELEKALGLAPEDMDPDKVLTTDETLKEAKKRLRAKSVGAVKQQRHRAKQKAKLLADHQHLSCPPEQ
jgi:hypothetical protein